MESQSLLVALAATGAAATPLHALQARQSTTKSDQARRWNALDSEGAWTAAVDSWTSKPSSNGLQFPQQISNFFHGPDQVFCGNEGVRDECGSYSTCDNVKAPAGMFILNSVVAMNYNFYDAMSKAETSVTATIGRFAGTFAPISDMSAQMKLALDLVGLGFALVAAPLWNSALKGVPYLAANGNTLGTLRDSINPIVSNGVTIAKDSSISTQNDLGTNVDILVKT